MSNFWERVVEELDYLGMNRTYLATVCNFSLTNIGQGIKLGSTPSAETAVKIAKALGVSVEYLVTGNKNPKSPTEKETEHNQLRLYRKYHYLIEKCEKIEANKVHLLEQIAENFYHNS